MEISFKEKRALVTGAGQGIGRDIAKQLVKCGAKVVAVSRTQTHLDTLKQEVPSIETVTVDLGDWSKTEEALKNVGPIDLLVNNAAVAILEPLLEVTEQSIQKSFDVNVKATMHVTQIVARDMIQRKISGGSIVNVSSQASMAGLENHAVYCATKGALDAFTRAAALELGPKNIRVNCVNPTVVLTDMGRLGWADPAKGDPMKAKIPLRRFAEVHEVVDAVLYLLSDRSTMINGVTLPIDGGFLAT